MRCFALNEIEEGYSEMFAVAVKSKRRKIANGRKKIIIHRKYSETHPKVLNSAEKAKNIEKERICHTEGSL